MLSLSNIPTSLNIKVLVFFTTIPIFIFQLFFPINVLPTNKELHVSCASQILFFQKKQLMVQSLKTIKRPIENELKSFEKRFRDDMRSNVPLLDKITYYIVQRKGKQVRPMFVFLCARLFGKINDATYHGASLVELLHTATLVHDDVVDDSYERRGLFSLNAMWKNKIAVIVGDYLLQKGFLIALQNKRFQLLEIVAEAVKQISEGELLKIEHARKYDITEDDYFEIIRKKTASLIAAACAVGAASNCDNEEDIEKMNSFGEKIGIAFQLKDELFDFGINSTRNPLGIDLQEKAMSLPFIYTLNRVSLAEKRKMINHVRLGKKANEVIALVRKKGGLKYAQNLMEQYQKDALATLETIPDSEAKESLKDLVNFVIQRKK